MNKYILFSDIDGTLAHYPQHFSGFAEIVSEDAASNHAVYRDKASGQIRECNILSSINAGNAYVSLKTIELVDQLRQNGFYFVLISGMRKVTFLKRLPFLPHADVSITENGGRIYFDKTLDIEWPKRFEKITGPIETNTPPEKRSGALWDMDRKLRAAGWIIDDYEYYANFRIDLRKNPTKTAEDLHAIVNNLPSEIMSTVNFNKTDFYPSVSGKGNAARYVMQMKNIDPKDSFALLDDDNDLPLAAAVHTVMLPGISSESVREAITRHPDWIIAKAKGILGVEELLERLIYGKM